MNFLDFPQHILNKIFVYSNPYTWIQINKILRNEYTKPYYRKLWMKENKIKNKDIFSFIQSFTVNPVVKYLSFNNDHLLNTCNPLYVFLLKNELKMPEILSIYPDTLMVQLLKIFNSNIICFFELFFNVSLFEKMLQSHFEELYCGTEKNKILFSKFLLTKNKKELTFLLEKSKNNFIKYFLIKTIIIKFELESIGIFMDLNIKDSLVYPHFYRYYSIKKYHNLNYQKSTYFTGIMFQAIEYFENTDKEKMQGLKRFTSKLLPHLKLKL